MSHLQVLIEDRLGEPLENFLAHMKLQGASCREVSRLLEELTDVKVSKSAVNRWLNE